MLGDLCLWSVARVEDDPVLESHALAGGEFEIARSSGLRLVHVVFAKGIGGEQSVVAGVPAGGVARIFRMIENSDADRLSLHRS